MNEATIAPDNLLLTLRGLLPSLNEQERKVGQYILNYPDEVMHLAITDLSERCGVSDTTVFRFCRRMGADGYQNLKIRLAQDIASSRPSTYMAAKPDDTIEAGVHNALAANIKALEDTLRVVDMVMLAGAAEALLAARRVDIYGAGGGAIAALDLQYKLMRVGVRAVPHADAEMQVVSATLLTQADAAVAISHSGESMDVLRALKVAAQSGAVTIAITNHPSSSIARAAHMSVCTAAQEAHAHGYPMGARVAQVGLIDALYACMALKLQNEVRDNHKRIAEALCGTQG